MNKELEIHFDKLENTCTPEAKGILDHMDAVKRIIGNWKRAST
jgi:hypothetical protein